MKCPDLYRIEIYRNECGTFEALIFDNPEDSTCSPEHIGPTDLADMYAQIGEHFRDEAVRYA